MWHPQCRELFAARPRTDVERHEAWLEDQRHLNMDLLKEHKKEMFKAAA